MIEVKGSHTTAKVFTNVPLENALYQIETLCNQSFMEDAKVRIMPDYHYGKGSTIGTTIKIKDKIVPNLVGVDVGCLDRKTEFLTNEGWKMICNYEKGDKVLQYDKSTDAAKFVEPLHYIVKECDEFIHFKNQKGLDQMVSDEHKVLLWKGYKSRGYKLESMRADEVLKLGDKLNKGYYGVKSAFNLDGGGLNLTDNEIRLDIMIAADGSIKYEGEDTHQIYMHLRKERKIKRVKELLRANSIDYKETSGKYGSTHIYFFVDKKFNKNLKKYWDANKRQLKIVSEESLLWDGHSGERAYFSSTDKSSADIVQFAFSANNIRAGISTVDYEEEGWNEVFVVTPTKNNVIGMTNTVKRVKSVDGKKYCFTVPSGYFVARRNGRVFITGNCGVLTVKINPMKVDFDKLDDIIRSSVPSGAEVHKEECTTRHYPSLDVRGFRASHVLTNERNNLSLGTLGGGNHFLEVSKDDEEYLYLTVHTGSRYVGAKIAQHYQKKAIESLKKNNIKELIEELKSQGKHSEIQGAIEKHKKENPEIPNDLAYLEGGLFKDYIHDMKIAQLYAQMNREEIANTILLSMGWGSDVVETFDTVHNYIDTDNMILRKGAVSAQKGEKLIIPINMRDGSIIATGKGNEDWNYSAPHGAGRVQSRTQARKSIKLKDFEETMRDVWSTSVNEETLDEAPYAYKTMKEIMSQIGDTVDIVKIIKPIYNFKASDKFVKEKVDKNE